MINLTKIDTSDARYEGVERLLLSAFPEDERRDTPCQRLYTDTCEAFNCCVIEDDRRPVGLITYWRFDGFCYVEHLAVDEHLRGHGYGAQALRQLSERMAMPIVLEVELPSDEISRRRIDFYRRQGFSLWDTVAYIQPPYRPGGNEVPMHLMAHGDLDPALDHHRIVSALRTHVYNA